MLRPPPLQSRAKAGRSIRKVRFGLSFINCRPNASPLQNLYPIRLTQNIRIPKVIHKLYKRIHLLVSNAFINPV
jgi:hypothetical protein